MHCDLFSWAVLATLRLDVRVCLRGKRDHVEKQGNIPRSCKGVPKRTIAGWKLFRLAQIADLQNLELNKHLLGGGGTKLQGGL